MLYDGSSDGLVRMRGNSWGLSSLAESAECSKGAPIFTLAVGTPRVLAGAGGRPTCGSQNCKIGMQMT